MGYVFVRPACRLYLMSKYFDTHFFKFCFCLYTARRGGSLSYDTEFMVIAVYQKQDGKSGATQRGIIKVCLF